MTHTTTSPEQTFELASKLARDLSGGDTLCLLGNLGAGKTAFTQGLAHGLGVLEAVTSPTFAIVNEYRSGRMPLYHFDVYRLNSPDELEDTAFYDYFTGEGVVVIEWADRIDSILQELVPNERRVNITITNDPNDDQSRHITINRGTA